MRHQSLVFHLILHMFPLLSFSHASSVTKSFTDACAQGDLEALKEMMREGFMAAVQAGRTDVLDLLLSNTCINEIDLDTAPLYDAIDREDVDMINYLTGCRIDFPVKVNKDPTCLYDAAERALQQGLDDTLVIQIFQTSFSIKSLKIAIRKGHYHLLKWMGEYWMNEFTPHELNGLAEDPLIMGKCHPTYSVLDLLYSALQSPNNHEQTVFTLLDPSGPFAKFQAQLQQFYAHQLCIKFFLESGENRRALSILYSLLKNNAAWPAEFSQPDLHLLRGLWKIRGTLDLIHQSEDFVLPSDVNFEIASVMFALARYEDTADAFGDGIIKRLKGEGDTLK